MLKVNYPIPGWVKISVFPRVDEARAMAKGSDDQYSPREAKRRFEEKAVDGRVKLDHDDERAPPAHTPHAPHVAPPSPLC